MNTFNHIRVVVADNNPVMRGAIKQLLESAQMEVIDEAKDGKEAIELTKRHQPDVLLLDVSLPVVNGLDVARQLREESSAILAYSALEDKATVLAMLQNGVKGYVLKSEEGKSVLCAVRAVSQGETFLSQRIQNHAIGLISNTLPYKSKLSQREQEVACLVAKDKSNKEIASQLFICLSTVKSHIKSLKNKLGVKTRIALAIQAIRLGLVCMAEIETALQLV